MRHCVANYGNAIIKQANNYCLRRKNMKRLYALVIALLMMCAGCDVKTTPEPQTIPPIDTPVQQGGNNTAAPDENMPTPPAEPSAPAEGDISPEIPDDLREALESAYTAAMVDNADVAGTMTGFDSYVGSDGKIYCNTLINSEDKEHYAQYGADGKWVKYGSVQIIGGKLNDDGTNIDGQIMILSKKYSGIFHILKQGIAAADINPIWLNLGGKIRAYKMFAIQAVEIDDWKDFISHKSGYIPHEAYELIENIENMDTSARTAYYAEIAKEFNGSALTIAEDDNVMIICGIGLDDGEWKNKMAVVYCVNI